MMTTRCDGPVDSMPCPSNLSSSAQPGHPRWSPALVKTFNKNYVILEEKAVVSGVKIKASSVEGLAEHLIQCFGPVCSGSRIEENNHYPRVMLLMHQWFISSTDLAKLLLELFWRADKMFDCPFLCRHRRRTQHECQVYEYRQKICEVFRYWVDCFPIHFDLDAGLANILRTFRKRLRDKGHMELADLVDLSRIPSYEWTRIISVRDPFTQHIRKVSLVFDYLKPHELADHLTHLEHKVMSKISFADFKNYAMSGTLQNNPKLERSISLFNCMTQWFQWMVLSKPLPQHRADVIEKIVLVAKRLLEVNNFNSLMAVVGGLSHSALVRLHQTETFITAETKKCRSELTELLDSRANFSNYRKVLSESKGFRIPVLCVHMKDLITLHTALPDTVHNKLINFRKMAHFSLIFQELWELQNASPPVDVCPDLVKTLKQCLEMPITEDDIYGRSLSLEPRQSSSPQPSPTKTSTFTSLAAGMFSSPETDLFEKHAQTIVENVFKKYDYDQDGFITQQELEEIANTFSFIDSFADLDPDQGGLISKDEMKRWFMQKNCHSLKNVFGHNIKQRILSQHFVLTAVDYFGDL